MGFLLGSTTLFGQSGPEACYALDGDANDATSNELHGTVHGATLTQGRTGLLNTAYRFDGVDDYIDISHPGFFNNTTWTYSCWVKLEQLPFNGESSIIMSVGGYGGDQVIAISNNYFGHNGFHTWSYGSPGTITSISTSQNPELNKWYFVVAVRSEYKLKLYVDGVLVSESDTPDISIGYGTDHRAVIGQRSHGVSVNSLFKGVLDEVRVHDYALKDKDIVALNKMNGCGLCEPAVSLKPEACYSFEKNALDGSGHGLNGITSSEDYESGFDNLNHSIHLENSQSVEISNPEFLNNTDYTFATWVKIEKLPSSGYSNILISIGGYGGDHSIAVSNNYFGNTGFHAWTYQNISTAHSIRSNVLPVAGTWYHVAATRSANNFALYVNGALVDSKTLNNAGITYGQSPKAMLGTRSHSVSINNYLTGNLDEVKVFNSALSVSDIAQLFVQSCMCRNYLVTGVAEAVDETSQGGVEIFPVPLEGSFSIRNTGKAHIERLLVEDIYGKDMLEINKHINPGETYSGIPSQLGQGVYILSCFDSDNNKISMHKIAVR